MANPEQRRSGEQDSVPYKVLFIPAIMVVVASLSAAYGRWSENADNRIRDVQIANEQIRDQLDATQPPDHLVLHDEARTFSFQRIPPEGGATETCSGNYQIEDEIATIVGPLSCMQVIPAPGQ